MVWVLGLAVVYISVVSWTDCFFRAIALADEKRIEAPLWQETP